MKLITLYLPETYIKALDQLVDERFYPNRAEAIRVTIRDLIASEVWTRTPLVNYRPPSKEAQLAASCEIQSHSYPVKREELSKDE
jgi:antitoxin ParD1/3/4